ncbi:periplasmic binding protein-like II [Neocallimastix lanati (nom. inval.)]|jgi:hypothetical protein|uniref:Periplasmic binding protein-like II n=1 Tax=Neocallimastix californiae TaxID=1754190 RepID=A0A1Y2BA31_9FUNG|nr:periplasmic binding protein-like II [Neocallimastix sp. JGI-2020a]ORY31702.1 periplasmic binding protein-like II [Neocallimastix californiae]|eukprot:ORY31702.1 periplasmic binding protein-like II [Neocallimastix californiae]
MIDSKKFGKYLTNLNEYLSETTTEKYKSGITNETYIVDNSFISIPLYLEYDMLYSNLDYLDKYEKPIPKTWNELIDTAKFIISEEQKDGNELIGYSADISDTEEGFCSLYEYIYSYRNGISEPYPEITNPEVEEAMKTLKRLKNELGTYGMRSSNSDISQCLNSTNCLFVKTWNNMPFKGNFTLTNLPGKVEGLSGSILGGYHLGVNKYITEEKKKKIAAVIEHIVEEESQKKISMQFGYQSALKDIYEDLFICGEYEQCQNFKTIQSILRPINVVENYKDYFKKYRNFLLKYLYEDSNLSECLSGIKYLTKVYVVNSELVNIPYMTIIGVTDLVMIFCYCFAFTKKHRFKFNILSPFYWFLYLLGMIIIMSYGFTGIGKLTEFKCRIRPIVFSLGFTMSNTVLLIRMLTNFPETEIIFSRFCRNHFGKAFLISIGFDIFLNSLALIEPARVETVSDNDKLYYQCKVESTLNLVAVILIFVYKFAILLGMAVAIFTEWNIEELKYDVHYAIATLFLSFIACIIYLMVSSLNTIQFSLQFVIPAFITYIYAVSCFFSYFIIRFFLRFSEDEESEEAIIKRICALDQSEKALNHFGSTDKTAISTNINRSSCSLSSKKNSIVDHLIILHNNGNEIKKSCEALRNSINSSSTNLSGTRVNIRKNSYGTSLESIRNFDESITMARRASQITAIPENKIADMVYSGSAGSNSNMNSNSYMNNNSVGQESYISDEFSVPSRTRTRSCENFNPTFTRTQRINSTPNKKYFGLGLGGYSKRSHENFPNPNSTPNNNNPASFTRKGSGISFTSVNPINASSYSNIPSRKCSTAAMSSITNSISSLSTTSRQSNNNITINGNGNGIGIDIGNSNGSQLSINKPISLMSNNIIKEGKANSIQNKNNNCIVNTDNDGNGSHDNENGNNELEPKVGNIKNDTTMLSVNPSLFTTTSFKSALDDNGKEN